MSDAPVISLDITNRIATITIDRQDRRNALNYTAVEALDAAVAQALSERVAAIIFTGAGGHFCAGADLKELKDQAFDTRLRVLLDNVAAAPIVTIAAISGACMGLGMQLALACDVRIATDDAYFGIPAAKLGIVVNHWTLNRLTWAVGPGAARHILLTAEVYRHEAALRSGLIQETGDLSAAVALAERVAALAPLAISGAKLGLNLIEGSFDDPEFNAALDAAWASEDLEEGRTAFAERRAPEFKGR